MKRTFLALPLIVILTTLAVVQAKGADILTQGSDTESVSAPLPVISVDNATAELGDIRKDSTATHTFILTNTGAAPLVLTSVSSGCGCTKIDYPAEPVAPGDTARIKVVYESSGRPPGYFTKLIRVRSNASTLPFRLYLKGRIL